MGEQLPMFDEPRPAPRAPEPSAPALRGLTPWQPWAYAVCRLGKRIENRPWAPWPAIIGQVIAIHAAAKVDPAEERRVADALAGRGLALPPPESLPRGAIVATARVVGCVRASADPWFFGPFGWQLADVVALPGPIACRGMQGLWPVPPDVAARVLSSREVPRG